MASASENIELLVASGQSVGELEDALGLSPGYLSKVRHGAVRSSPQLQALLEVVRTHPKTLATVARVTRDARTPSASPERSPPTRRARAVLTELAPRLTEAEVRWAITGRTALRLHGAQLAEERGVDVLVDERDRHVLATLRQAGLHPVYRTPALTVCHVDPKDPNESLRVHFPTTLPLVGAFDQLVHLLLDGARAPVVDLDTLALAELLSQRTGSDEAAAGALAAGASWKVLSQRLCELEALPPTTSAYVLRVFDRALARRRLDATP